MLLILVLSEDAAYPQNGHSKWLGIDEPVNLEVLVPYFKHTHIVTLPEFKMFHFGFGKPL